MESFDTVCSNFSFFKDHLKLLRKVDDNIIHKLNNIASQTHPSSSANDPLSLTQMSKPSSSITDGQRCLDMFTELQKSYQQRDRVITECLSRVNKRIDSLNSDQRSGGDDYNADVDTELFELQNERRQIRSEKIVEEIVRERTLTELKRRCQALDIKK